MFRKNTTAKDAVNILILQISMLCFDLFDWPSSVYSIAYTK